MRKTKLNAPLPPPVAERPRCRTCGCALKPKYRETRTQTEEVVRRYSRRGWEGRVEPIGAEHKHLGAEQDENGRWFLEEPVWLIEKTWVGYQSGDYFCTQGCAVYWANVYARIEERQGRNVTLYADEIVNVRTR